MRFVVVIVVVETKLNKSQCFLSFSLSLSSTKVYNTSMLGLIHSSSLLSLLSTSNLYIYSCICKKNNSLENIININCYLLNNIYLYL